MDLSIIIPARNEEFLSKTIEDILEHIEGNTEVIAILDGYWPEPSIKDHPKVVLLHYSESIGQRAATNQGVQLSRAKYIMKVDAHCAFDQGFDVKMMKNMQDDWIMVPIMKNLHAFDWVCPNGHRRYQGKSGVCEKCGEPTEKDVVWIAKKSPNSTAYRFDNTLHFQYWGDYKKKQKGNLVETMSLQGSCWMVTRDKYWEYNLSDEAHGSWGQQGSECSLKFQTTGNKVVVNKHTWYAHMFRTQGGDFGFPYPNPGVKKAREYSRDLWFNNKFDKQIYPLSWVVKKYSPIPGWSDVAINEQIEREMKSKRSGIYSITNKDKNKVYIGSAKKISQRFGEHLRRLRRNDHENKHLQNSWNKYKEDSFSFEILRFCDKEDLLFYEQKYLDLYREELGWNNMFNMNPNTRSGFGRKYIRKSFKTKEKQIELDNKEKWDSRKKLDKVKLNWLKEKPSGDVSKGILYYTDNKLDEKIMKVCQNQLSEAVGQNKTLSVSLKDTHFGTSQIVLPLKRGYLTMAKQILKGLETLDTDIVFFTEHDILYHSSHFDFSPPKKDIFYYNDNVWFYRVEDGHALHYDANQLSGLCAYREPLLKHFKERVALIEKKGYSTKIGFEPMTHNRIEWKNKYGYESWKSKEPNIDIRHGGNLSGARWKKEEFRNKKFTKSWAEGDVPVWAQNLVDLI